MIPPHSTYNQTRPLPTAPYSGPTLPLGPPPPIPPCLCSPPDPPIQFTQQEPTYIPFSPALDPPIHRDTLQPPLLTTTPSPSPSVSPSKMLPTVAHIPVLTSKNDFFPWNEGVYALIQANGLIGHILDPSAHIIKSAFPFNKTKTALPLTF